MGLRAAAKITDEKKGLEGIAANRIFNDVVKLSHRVAFRVILPKAKRHIDFWNLSTVSRTRGANERIEKLWDILGPLGQTRKSHAYWF